MRRRRRKRKCLAAESHTRFSLLHCAAPQLRCFSAAALQLGWCEDGGHELLQQRRFHGGDHGGAGEPGVRLRASAGGATSPLGPTAEAVLARSSCFCSLCLQLYCPIFKKKNQWSDISRNCCCFKYLKVHFAFFFAAEASPCSFLPASR